MAKTLKKPRRSEKQIEVILIKMDQERPLYGTILSNTKSARLRDAKMKAYCETKYKHFLNLIREAMPDRPPRKQLYRIAEKLNLFLRADNRRFGGAAILHHEDGSFFYLQNAFWDRIGQWFFVFTEHNGFHIFHEDDLTHASDVHTFTPRDEN